jgi:hypothetical protein
MKQRRVYHSILISANSNDNKYIFSILVVAVKLKKNLNVDIRLVTLTSLFIDF